MPPPASLPALLQPLCPSVRPSVCPLPPRVLVSSLGSPPSVSRPPSLSSHVSSDVARTPCSTHSASCPLTGGGGARPAGPGSSQHWVLLGCLPGRPHTQGGTQAAAFTETVQIPLGTPCENQRFGDLGDPPVRRRLSTSARRAGGRRLHAAGLQDLWEALATPTLSFSRMSPRPAQRNVCTASPAFKKGEGYRARRAAQRPSVPPFPGLAFWDKSARDPATATATATPSLH